MANATMAVCNWCGISVKDVTTVPGALDDAGWTALALLHRPGCEWIVTRAHQVPLVGTLTVGKGPDYRVDRKPV